MNLLIAVVLEDEGMPGRGRGTRQSTKTRTGIFRPYATSAVSWLY